MTKEKIENAIGFITENAISNPKIVNIEKIFIAKNDISNYIKDLETKNKALNEEISKYIKAIDILKDSFDLSVGIWHDFKGNIQGYYISGADENNNCAYIDITKEQYELLKEVLENDK